MSDSTYNQSKSRVQLQTELAQDIVKVLRGDPLAASTEEHQRIIALIAQYTLQVSS